MFAILKVSHCIKSFSCGTRALLESVLELIRTLGHVARTTGNHLVVLLVAASRDKWHNVISRRIVAVAWMCPVMKPERILATIMAL